jgi:hypothetical protein
MVEVMLNVEPAAPESVGVEPAVVASVSVKLGPSITRVFALFCVMFPIVRSVSRTVVPEVADWNVAVLPDPLATVPPFQLAVVLQERPVPPAHVQAPL